MFSICWHSQVPWATATIQVIKGEFFAGYYGNTGCGVFKWGVQNLKDFCLRINILKGNHWILRIGLMGRCQKLGIVLESKWFKNWCYQKMSITKNVLLNWYSLMKKKLRKIRIIFDIENWLWKSRGWVILHFLTPPH